jgi:hypothetical protein
MRLILIGPNGRIPDRRTVVSVGRSRTDYGLADCKELSTFGAPDWLGRSQGLLFEGDQRWSQSFASPPNADLLSSRDTGYGRRPSVFWAP